MASDERIRKYLDAGSVLGQVTRGRAEEIMRELVNAGEGPRDQAQEWMDNVVEQSRKTSESLIDTVRREVAAALKRIDPSALEQIANQVSEILRRSAEAGRNATKDATEHATKAAKDATEHATKAAKDATEHATKAAKDATERASKASKDARAQVEKTAQRAREAAESALPKRGGKGKKKSDAKKANGKSEAKKPEAKKSEAKKSEPKTSEAAKKSEPKTSEAAKKTTIDKKAAS